MANFERFLDEALLHHVSPIMVIHGHGTGAIKAAVRDFLKTSNYPVEFRPGETFEGGDGVTVITF
jgi:DNA mismatch repair protein MutS2